MDREIARLGSRTAYENRWMTVREDSVRFPDGTESIFGVVDKAPFAVIVPIHEDGRIQLVEQFRYPVGRLSWEVPQGAWEGRADVDPVMLAHGELEEETGFRAGRMELLGHFHQAPGYSSQGYHLFRASDLTLGVVKRDAEEQGMETAAFTLAEILQMTERGALFDCTTIAALGYLNLTGALSGG